MRLSLAVVRPFALDWSVENCPIGRSMEILGEKWTMVVLREVFNGIRRFDDMQEHTGIPRQVLTNRLAKLVETGVLRRVPYQDPGSRPRDEYRLTEMGLDLYPVLVALLEWGRQYLLGVDESPLTIAHRECGAPVHLELHCADGHELGSAREAAPRPGPGARRRAAAELEEFSV
jgi:DNA-binding HxlR family transcriptional regulator